MTMTAPPIPGVAQKYPYTVMVSFSDLVRMSEYRMREHREQDRPTEVMLSIKEAREARAALTRNPGIDKFEVERQGKMGFNTVYGRFEDIVMLASELANWASDNHLGKYVQNKNDYRVKSRARFLLHDRVREGVFTAYPVYDNGKIYQRLGATLVQLHELPKSVTATALIGSVVRVYDIEGMLMFIL